MHRASLASLSRKCTLACTLWGKDQLNKSGRQRMFIRRFNPFYPLSILVGIAFLITAAAYGVMALRGASPQLLDGSDESPLMTFLDKHGVTLFLLELGILTVTTVAAIITDGYWMGNASTAAPTAGDADESELNTSGESKHESAE